MGDARVILLYFVASLVRVGAVLLLDTVDHVRCMQN